MMHVQAEPDTWIFESHDPTTFTTVYTATTTTGMGVPTWTRSP